MLDRNNLDFFSSPRSDINYFKEGSNPLTDKKKLPVCQCEFGSLDNLESMEFLFYLALQLISK